MLDKKKIKYYSCIKELNIDKYKLEFLNTLEYDNENDNSNVIYFNYEGNKFLFMGDAGEEKEKDILEKYNLSNIDFLKVGHHGTNTSSSEYFINSINPKYSLISVGKNNRYGHPKDAVLEKLMLENLNDFLSELGTDFCYVGNEYKIRVGDRYNYIDLLLFNIEFNCYVVIELKVTELNSIHIGQIQKYMNYVDRHIKTIDENETVGIIICKKIISM